MLHHRPAEVRLAYNGVGFVPVVGVRCNLAPSSRSSLDGEVGSKISITISPQPSHNNTDCIVVGVISIISSARINSHNDTYKIRNNAIRNAPPLDMLFLEQLVWRCICKLSV